MQLAVFGFQGTNSESIATNIAAAAGGSLTLLTTIDSIAHYQEQLVANAPDYILGLGRYTGRDRGQLRLETKCSSKFRRSFVPARVLPIRPWIASGPMVKPASGIGNSYCNAASWMICNMIEINHLQSRYTFVHVPTDFDVRLATNILMEAWLAVQASQASINNRDGNGFVV